MLSSRTLEEPRDGVVSGAELPFAHGAETRLAQVLGSEAMRAAEDPHEPIALAGQDVRFHGFSRGEGRSAERAAPWSGGRGRLSSALRSGRRRSRGTGAEPVSGVAGTQKRERDGRKCQGTDGQDGKHRRSIAAGAQPRHPFRSP